MKDDCDLNLSNWIQICFPYVLDIVLPKNDKIDELVCYIKILKVINMWNLNVTIKKQEIDWICWNMSWRSKRPTRKL